MPNGLPPPQQYGYAPPPPPPEPSAKAPVGKYVIIGVASLLAAAVIVGVVWFVMSRRTTSAPTPSAQEGSDLERASPPREPTPEERERYGIKEGYRIRTVDTPSGTVLFLVPPPGEQEPPPWDPAEEPPFPGKEPYQP